MKVELLHHSPLWIASKAIRKCYASEDKSDTTDETLYEDFSEAGKKDKELIYRVGNKFAHKSTLRHVTYVFECDDVSTKTLLALSRHCIGKDISVQSTRWTTKKRKGELSYTRLSVEERNRKLDAIMDIVQSAIDEGWSNDDISMLLPQAYNYSFIMTMNIESLQWFLKMRTAKDAHWNIQELAHKLYEQIPLEHKYLFEDFVYEDK